MIPLYGFLEGDTLGLVILADPEESVSSLATKLQSAAQSRVAEKVAPLIIFKERKLNPAITVRAAGMEALDRFDVVEGAGGCRS